jgi:hypothetical protein
MEPSGRGRDGAGAAGPIPRRPRLRGLLADSRRPAIAGRLQTVLFALHHSGLPELINYSFVEFASNILLFAPIGILAALAFPAFHRGRIVLARSWRPAAWSWGRSCSCTTGFRAPWTSWRIRPGAMLGVWVLGVVEQWLREAQPALPPKPARPPKIG